MAIKAVYCQLNGHELAMRLDLTAMAELEDRGFPIEEIVAHLQTGTFSAKRLRLLLWAMLQSAEPPPSVADVGRWVDGGNFVHVTEKVGEALRLAFPEATKESPPVPPPGAGTGEPPSASPTARSP